MEKFKKLFCFEKRTIAKYFLHSLVMSAGFLASLMISIGTAQASVEIHIQGYNTGNPIASGVSSGNNGGTALNVFGTSANTYPLNKNGNNNNQSFDQATKLTFSGTTVAQSAVSFNYETAPGSGVTTIWPPNGPDDGLSSQYSLPFPITMYGRADDSFEVCSNGFIALNQTTVSGSESCPYSSSNLATAFSTTTDHIIAPEWVDLYPTGTTNGTVSFWTDGTAPNRVFVIQFNNVSPYSSGGGNSFEVKFNESDVATVPGAPTNLTAAGRDGSADLSWNAPSSDGGSSITGYTIRYGVNGSCDPTTSPYTNCSSTTSTSASDSVTGLTNGTTYVFAVYAENSVGESASSGSATATPNPPTVPGAPTNLAATPDASQVSLTWTTPASDGNSPITDYTVEYRTPPGTGTYTAFSHTASTATTQTVTGLTNGTSYEFRVSAVNSVGTGSASSTVTATPHPSYTTPSNPNNACCGIGITNITLNGESSGGTINNTSATPTSTSDGYHNYTGQQTNSTDTHLGIPDLAINSNYTISVTTGTSAQVTSAWIDFNGDGNFQSTEQIMSNVSSSTNPATKTFSIPNGTPLGPTRLRIGTDYSSYQVNSSNGPLQYGEFEDYTVNIVAALPPTNPGAPTLNTATVGNASVALSWTAPTNTGHTTLTDYKYFYGLTSGFPGNATEFNAGHTPSTSTSVTVTGLTNNANYSFYVEAVNSAGNSSPSNTLSATPSAYVIPSNPSYACCGIGITNVTLTGESSGGTINNTTATPASTTDAYHDYTGQQTNPTDTHLGIPDLKTASTYTIQLSPGTNYPQTFSAWIDYGDNGTFNDSGKIVLNQFTASNTQISVQFTIPSDATLGQTRLRVGTDYNTNQVNSPATGPQSYGEFEDYTVNIVSNNLPGAPQNLGAIPGNGQVVLSWTSPSSTGTSAISSYTIRYGVSGSCDPTTSPYTNCTTVTGITPGTDPQSSVIGSLVNGTSYNFAVAAVNGSGEGPSSSHVTGTPNVPSITLLSPNGVPTGDALNFDGGAGGGNAIVQIPYNSTLDLSTQGSASAWVKFNQLPSDAGHIMAIVNESEFQNDFDLQAETDNHFYFYAQLGNNGNIKVASTTTIETGKWYYVAITYSGNNEIKIYVNGKLENSLSIPGHQRHATTNPFSIGYSPVWSGRNFNGTIDDVSLWNVERTQTDIENDMDQGLSGNETNLVAYLPFDDASGTTATDLTSNHNNGTLSDLNGGSDLPTWNNIGLRDTWPNSSTQTIQWDSFGFSGNVKVELSRNGASGTYETLFDSIPNTGSVDWTVTGSGTTNAFIRVSSGDDSSINDVSDNAFTILPPPPPSAAPCGGYTSISAGDGFAIGLQGNGSVWGTGPSTNQILGFNNITEVSSGFFDTFGIDQNGYLWGSGSNSFGQLGQGNTTNYSTTREVLAGASSNSNTYLSNIVSVAPGELHTLAVDSSGNLWSWGLDELGALGDGNSSGDVTTPTQVLANNGTAGSGPYFTNAKKVAASADTSYVIDGNGNLWGWGDNFGNELGFSSNGRAVTAPTQVQALSNVIDVSTSQFVSIALTGNINDPTNNVVWTWGRNQAPAPVQGLSNITQISSFNGNFEALKNDGTVWTWGYGGNGELGNGSTQSSSIPIQVLVNNGIAGTAGTGPYLANIKSIASGIGFMLALDNSGNIWGWGYQGNGEFGNNAWLLPNQQQYDTPIQALPCLNPNNGPEGTTVTMAGANFVSGDSVTFDGVLASNVSVSSGGKTLTATAPSHSAGTVTVVVTDTDGQTATYTNAYTYPSTAAADSTNSTLSITPNNPANEPANGTSTFLLKAVLKDGSNNPTIDKAVSINANPPNSTITQVDCNDSSTVTPGTLTGSDGIACFTASSTTTGSETFSATDTTDNVAVNQTVTGNFIAPPTIGSVNPPQGSNAGGTNITITGAGFENGATVKVGGSAATNVVFGNATSITATTPAGTAGAADVEITNPDGGSATLTGGFTYQAPLPPTACGFTAMDAGFNHTVAIKTDGTVLDWGFNNSGELGNGTTTESHIPVTINGLSNVIAVSNNSDINSGFTLALKSDGTVWAWGSDIVGELGDGGSTNSSTPVQVSGLTNVTAIYAGGSHSLALKSDGTVWAWGGNIHGVLGNGSTTNSNVPVQVTGLTNVTAIAAGGTYSLAIVNNDGNNHTVWAWGINDQGELGNGTTTESHTPVQVQEQSGPLTGIVAISGGNTHALALKNDGTVFAWGRGLDGELGNGANSQSDYAINIPGLSGVTAISGGEYYSMALMNDGTVQSWGDNAYGELGNGTTNSSNTPAQVPGLSGITAINAGQNYGLALTNTGTMEAWGSNNHGQFGNGTTTDSTSPIQISASCIDPSTGPTAGGTAVTISGNNFQSGATVTFDTNNSATNVTVVDSHTITVTTPSHAAGAVDVVITNPDSNSVTLAGAFTYISQPTAPSFCGTFTNLGSADTTSLGLKDNGTVWSWGYGQDGALGNGTFANNTPIGQVLADSSATFGTGPYLSNITAISGGLQHVLAIQSSAIQTGNPAYDTVLSWGLNSNGQLGNGSNTPLNTDAPAKVLADSSAIPGSGPYLSNVIAVSGGLLHSLALKNDHTVWAWGDNAYGALGNGTTTDSYAPVQVSGLPNIKAIAGGGFRYNNGFGDGGHSLALDTNGNVWAWGDNANGQLGYDTNQPTNNPPNGTYSEVPQQVSIPLPSGATITAISAGQLHSLALDTNGNVWAWGDDQYGELGDGTNNNSPAPIQISIPLPSGATITAIRALGFHSLALDSNGNVWAWGDNQFGGLGNGNNTNSNVPVEVLADSSAVPGSGPYLSNVTDINGGTSPLYNYSLALKSDGTIWDWGDNQYGTLGDGTSNNSNVPVQALSSCITPNTGPTTGGTSVTILGNNFQSGASVTFDGTAATNVNVVNQNTITATTPPHAAGAVDVSITNSGSQPATMTNGFTYTSNNGGGGTPDQTQSTFVANPTIVAADGTTTSTLTVTLKDINGISVSGKTVTVAQTGGPTTPSAPNINTVSGTTDNNGVATFTVSSTTVGIDTFTATDTTDNITLSHTANVQFICSSGTQGSFNSTSGQQCATLGINQSSGSLSITKVPDSFTFAAGSPGQDSFSTPSGPDDSDLVTVSDTRNSGGFTLQLQNSSNFANTTDSTETIPLNNFYVTTSSLADNTIDSHGIACGGLQYLGGSASSCSGITADITTPFNINGPFNDQNSYNISGNTLNGIVNLMQTNSNHNGSFSTFTNYLVKIPPGQKPGSYQVLLTFTVF